MFNLPTYTVDADETQIPGDANGVIRLAHKPCGTNCQQSYTDMNKTIILRLLIYNNNNVLKDKRYLKKKKYLSA